MNILGIETSCDETGIAIYNTEKQLIISEQLFSQASKHAQYGGCLLYTSPSPRDQRGSRMPSSA